MDEKQILKNENFSRDLRASTDSKHDAESDQKSWRICLLQVSGAELIKTIVGEWRSKNTTLGQEPVSIFN